MRKEFLIGGLILLILGFIISGIIGSILLGLGILILLYSIFGRGNRRTETRYVEYENSKPSKKETSPPSEKKSSAKYVEETRPRYKNVDRAERELKDWDSNKGGKKCPSCGSNNNPPGARFCADCGEKL
jgi:hypothetical protein